MQIMKEKTVRRKQNKETPSVAAARNAIWTYILEGLPVIALASAGAGLLEEIPYLSLEAGFLLLYFAAFFFAGLIFLCMDRRTLMFRLLPAIPLTVLLISRDLPLFFNAAAALLLFALLHLIRHCSAWKWCLSGLFLLCTVLWFIFGGMPGYAAVSLVFLFTAAVSEFWNRQSRYWGVLLAIVAGIALAIPNSEDPMRWEGVRRFFSRVGDYIVTAYRDVSYFFEGLFDTDDTAYTGYSEAGRLSGGLSDSGREAIFFDTNESGRGVYLAGAEYAKLGPEGFTERLNSGLPVNAWLAMYLSALAESDVTKAEASCFSGTQKGTVTYHYIRTSDLLLPSTVYRIDKGLEYGSGEQRKKGFSYGFNYIALDQANPYFARLAEQSERRAASGLNELPGTEGSAATYEDAAKVAKEYYSLNLSDYMSEEEYQTCIRAYQSIEENDEYLDTSMSTKRIKELAAQLTEGCETSFEKAKQIEAYLRQYTYDASTDLRGRDNYVDAFLFEVERGYCVHYASAMVLLLRENGIPARFVQGFLYLPSDEDAEKDKNKGEAVYDRNAHAWVEAYISGLGWIRFEPTAVYENAEDTAWGLMVSEAGPSGSSGTEKNPSGQADIPKPPEIPIPQGQTDPEALKQGHSVWQILRTVGLYLLSVVAASGILLLITLLVRRIRYARLSPERRLMTDMQVLRKRLDAGLPDGVTAESVYDYLPYVKEIQVREKLESVFRGYYRVRFRGDAAKPEFVEQVRKISREIRRDCLGEI